MQIKKNIDFNKGFRSLLEVIKLIAVAEYYSLERRLRRFGRFGEVLGEFVAELDGLGLQHPFLQGSGGPMGVVAVTSDAGLLGGINMQVISRAAELVHQQSGKLFVVGSRGQVYAQDMRIPHTFFPGIVDQKRFEQACELRDHLMKEVLSGALGSLTIVYPHAVSFVVHRVEVVPVLPLPKAEAARPIAGEMIFEAFPKDALEYLAYMAVGQALYEVFGMSRLTEQAARFVHLEESCQKILEMNQKLTLQYFKRRHEVIDQNMRELFAARSLYAK